MQNQYLIEKIELYHKWNEKKKFQASYWLKWNKQNFFAMKRIKCRGDSLISHQICECAMLELLVE
jgi:hypothetical protein